MFRRNVLCGAALLAVLSGAGCSYLAAAGHVNKSSALIGQGEYQAAIAEATKAIEAKPDLDLGYVNRAIAYQNARQYDNALSDYRRAMALNPDGAITHLDYVLLLVFLRRSDEGAKDADEFLSRHSNSGLCRLALAEALLAQRNPDRAYEITTQALQALQSSPSADELKHVPKDHLFAYAYGLQGRIAAELNRPVEAQQAIDKAATFRNDFGTRFARVKTYYAEKDWQRAASEMNAAYANATLEEKNSGFGIESHFLLGNCALHLGQLDEARREYEEFLSANKAEPEAFFNLGQVYAKSGSRDKAVENYSAALRLNSDLVDAHANRGTLYLQMGRYQDAIRDFSDALAKQPRETSLLYKRAYSYCASGHAGMGQQDLRAVLQSDPGNAQAKALLKECGKGPS
jgi:tetratricopeptide (TPR) repeat protein